MRGTQKVKRTPVLRQEREDRIIEWIGERGKATVSELSDAFGVSEATIRRDLQRLAVSHRIRRAHGGAMRVEEKGAEPPAVQRMKLYAEEKLRIGQEAARLVHDGETILLVSGTTVLEVARHLTERRDLTVITDSFLVSDILLKDPHIRLIMLGGTVRHSELSVLGHLTRLCLNEIQADKVIMGVRAVSLQHGLLSDTFAEAETHLEFMHRADEVIVVVDHSKFDESATAILAPLSVVDRIVTGRETPLATVEALHALGIEVILA